ncbi:MAG: pyruvate synthase [Candidatus Omnitrophota bacterium]|nr:pyruvate synthase [Candidatus Omnitrophota bacterium]
MFAAKVAKPGKSRANKTGSWRTEQKPKFLQKNCIACNMCLLFCPEGCIKGEDKNTYICDLEYCKGCGGCAIICPKKDIVMEKEK